MTYSRQGPQGGSAAWDSPASNGRGPAWSGGGDTVGSRAGPAAASSPTTLDLPQDDHFAHEAAPLPESVAGSFGTPLEPVLQRTCNGRLSDVTWFRTDWQRGGAMTGYASYHGDDGRWHPVVVKLPVPPCERHWLQALQAAGDVAPRLYAHGEALNGYDMAWVVIERVEHGPLGSAWQGAEFDLLVEAAGRFYAAAHQIAPHGQPLHRNWHQIYDHARRAVHDRALPDAQRWNRALKKIHRKVKSWIKDWNSRAINDWCHGDLHLGNALTRDPAPHGPALLIDFAHTRVGHWVEDAVYFEHLYWSRRWKLGGRKLCSLIAQERKRRGLQVEPHWPHLAQIKRNLLAMSTPAQLRHEGDPQHVHAALEILEANV